jgi:hypothetical protein
MFSNSIKKALVVAGVALTLPVLSAGTAYADSDNGHGKGTDKHDAAVATASSDHGKGSETDPSGSSTNPDGTFQGKSSSTPDQDGTGMDRGADNNDKTGPGTDGNNGCGNEPRLAAPRDGGRPTDDDNNGWCGSKPTPQHKASPARVAVKATSHTSVAKVDAPASVLGVVTPAAPALAAPAPGTAAKVVANGTVTPLVDAPMAASVRGAGFVGPVAGSSVAAASAAAPAALPFTGAPVGLLLLVSGLLLALGALTALAGTRRTA